MDQKAAEEVADDFAWPIGEGLFDFVESFLVLIEVLDHLGDGIAHGDYFFRRQHVDRPQEAISFKASTIQVTMQRCHGIESTPRTDGRR